MLLLIWRRHTSWAPLLENLANMKLFRYRPQVCRISCLRCAVDAACARCYIHALGVAYIARALYITVYITQKAYHTHIAQLTGHAIFLCAVYATRITRKKDTHYATRILRVMRVAYISDRKHISHAYSATEASRRRIQPYTQT